MTPWCGPCKIVKAQLDETELKLATDSINILIATVDCDNDFWLCDKYNILGLPTILFFKNSETNYDIYTGFRTSSEMIDFLEKQQ